MDMKSEFTDLCNKAKEIQREYNRLRDKLSELDLTLSDLDHLLEIYDFNASVTAKIMKRRKDTLRNRRQVKRNLAEAGLLVSKLTVFTDTSLANKFDKLGSENRFTVRVLVDELGEYLYDDVKPDTSKL